MKWFQTRTGVNYVFYPITSEGLYEPAICLQPYSDCVTLETDEAVINIPYDSIPEFIKVLKEIHKENKKQ